MISEYIERVFSAFLQSKISFDINGKSIKKGKLILIAIKDFHIFFVLQADNGEKKQFILPLPFDVEKKSDVVALDFTLKTLSRHNNDVYLKLRTTTKKKNTRFFDTIVHCKRVN